MSPLACPRLHTVLSRPGRCPADFERLGVSSRMASSRGWSRTQSAVTGAGSFLCLACTQCQASCFSRALQAVNGLYHFDENHRGSAVGSEHRASWASICRLICPAAAVCKPTSQQLFDDPWADWWPRPQQVRLDSIATYESKTG